MKTKGNIIIGGVGGQGILLASEVTARALIEGGFDVKKSEVHGMAQRGGSVVAHLRYGEKVYSPLIEQGAADLVLSFELLETLRYLPFAGQDTRVIVNTQRIFPPSVATGQETYPEGVLEKLAGLGISTFPINAFEMASALGETRSVNMIMVGALSNFVPVEEEAYFSVLSGTVPEKYFEMNRQAFTEGRKFVENEILNA